ncbi:MAG: hypothetical protein ACJ77D_08270 [Chloroflexota bacterium]
MTIVEETLETWRDAERLLEQLPPVHPDHESVALAVSSLRETYQNLTAGASERTPAVVTHSRASIERTRELLERIHAKLDRTDVETV